MGKRIDDYWIDGAITSDVEEPIFYAINEIECHFNESENVSDEERQKLKEIYRLYNIWLTDVGYLSRGDFRPILPQDELNEIIQEQVLPKMDNAMRKLEWLIDTTRYDQAEPGDDDDCYMKDIYEDYAKLRLAVVNMKRDRRNLL